MGDFFITAVIKRLKKIGLIGFLVGYCTMGYAATQGTKYWTAVNVDGPVSRYSKVLYLLGYQGRTDANKTAYERTLLFGGLGYQYSSVLNLWLGYQWNSKNYISGANPQNRIWEQANWAIIHKKMVRIPKKFNGCCTPVLYDEIFLNLTHPQWINNNQWVGQNRMFMGLVFDLSKKTHLELGYINQYIWNNAGNSVNHILSLSFDVKT